MNKPGPGMPTRVVLADGKEHTLRYPLRILRELRQQHNLDLLHGGPQIAEAFRDPDMLALVLSYGLWTANPEATVEWVEDNVDAAMLMDIAPMLIYAATGQWVNLNGASANGANLPNAAASGATAEPTSSSSGASDATISDSVNTSSGT